MLSILYFLLGIIAYSFIEYVVHRWVLHGPMKKKHWEHHRDPTKDLHTPILIMAPALLVVFLLAGPAMMFGILVCWCGSAAVHNRLHVGIPTPKWLWKLRKHHAGHHRKVGNADHGGRALAVLGHAQAVVD